MGAAASVELEKPVDGSDVTSFEDAKAEVVRLRAKLAEAVAEQGAAPVAVASPVEAVAVAVAVPVETWAKSVFEQFDTNADGKVSLEELDANLQGGYRQLLEACLDPSAGFAFGASAGLDSPTFAL